MPALTPAGVDIIGVAVGSFTFSNSLARFIDEQAFGGERTGMQRDFGRGGGKPAVTGVSRRWRRDQPPGRMGGPNGGRNRIEVELPRRPTRVRGSQHLMKMLAKPACAPDDV
jgi:hypothetical protein